MATKYSMLPVLGNLTAKNMLVYPYTFLTKEDTLQLQADTLNVIEGRVDISTFPKDYQEKIKNYYRFSATWNTSKQGKAAKRTRDTLDIV